tara:strand:- start:2052 stop:2159 length:108 start_codon:yes stop_codon:yes gene_type:complete
MINNIIMKLKEQKLELKLTAILLIVLLTIAITMGS